MEDAETNEEIDLSFWGQHRFFLLIMIAIVISAILVGISMAMYNGSGAAQLDLSRPGYVNVRDKTVDSSSEFKNYPDSGVINQSAVDDFKAIYNEQATKTKAADAFKGDPLSPDSLGINSLIIR
ncbi:MAG: hypothetical protein WCI79_00680 [Candidatus Saccharibacteria bacterium]